MKRFWAYAGSRYYPTEAGYDDFVGAFHSATEAATAAKAACEKIDKSIDETSDGRFAWWEVIKVTDEGPKVLTDELREKE